LIIIVILKDIHKNISKNQRDRWVVMNAGMLAIIFIGVLLIGLLFYGVSKLSEE
jgi:hypothetical protein